MIPIISFIGSSGSGKTTLLEKVVTELENRDIRVAVIKHAPHGDLDFDINGKDSQRYSSAGAVVSIVSGPKEIAFIKKTDHDLSPDEITRLIDPDVDVILTEGFKHAGTLKIEVHRKSIETELLANPNELLAVITDEPLNVNVPQFDIMNNNIIEMADLIEKWVSEQPKNEIKLLINKEVVELNPFVEDIIAKTVESMLYSLQGVDTIDSFQISLLPRADKRSIKTLKANILTGANK
jgi:molybdopterin-guanine dinucleotide biosynthesis protein B